MNQPRYHSLTDLLDMCMLKSGKHIPIGGNSSFSSFSPPSVFCHFESALIHVCIDPDGLVPPPLHLFMFILLARVSSFICRRLLSFPAFPSCTLTKFRVIFVVRSWKKASLLACRRPPRQLNWGPTEKKKGTNLATASTSWRFLLASDRQNLFSKKTSSRKRFEILSSAGG